MTVNHHEIRWDAWRQAEVLVAPGRKGIGGGRPGGLPTPQDRCPFCPGHEADTENTLWATPVVGPWQVRVVANRYPATGHAPSSHDVIIEHPKHDIDIGEMSADEMFRILCAWRARYQALANLEGTASIILFRNCGMRAGSSQPHPHSQIAALPFVPPEVLRRQAAVSTARTTAPANDSPLATLIAQEGDARVLVSDTRLVAFVPHAPDRPAEIRIAWRASTRWQDLTDPELQHLADILPRMVAAQRQVTRGADYNIIVRTSPLRAEHPFIYIDLIPRTGGDAGFELETGMPIIVITPEASASALRLALQQSG